MHIKLEFYDSKSSKYTAKYVLSQNNLHNYLDDAQCMRILYTVTKGVVH